MKKSTIWILTIVMALAFTGFMCMQMIFIHKMVKMRYEQFDEAVKQSLYGVSQRLNQDEVRYFLEESVRDTSFMTLYPSYFGNQGLKYKFTSSTGLKADLTITGNPSEITRIKTSNSGKGDLTRELQSLYMRQKTVLDEVIVNIMSRSATRPLSERADSAIVSEYIAEGLKQHGLNMPFEFKVMNHVGTVMYKTAGYKTGDDGPGEEAFNQALFPNDRRDQQLTLSVYFPSVRDYVFDSLKFMYPTIAFTIIVLIVFIITIILVFRQKRLTEMKNDFINNMTHEFKTPISSISLAAQMLNDQAIRKSPAMLQQISNVINDETKRLRFQVEKVLQMSMFERQRATMKLEDVDANVVIFNVVNTFKLKVEKYGGKITAHLDAMDAIVTVDEMHFTNVIFNLLDNAVKYRKEDVPLHLTVTSRDISDERLEITIGDNGIGIKKDDVKRIFEKFYRVSTGNRHDVKGFGLGLAYVHKMIKELDGEISVESEYGTGTKFIIILPLSKN